MEEIVLEPQPVIKSHRVALKYVSEVELFAASVAGGDELHGLMSRAKALVQHEIVRQAATAKQKSILNFFP